MRICFLTTPEPEPLQDLLFCGLRLLLGEDAVDHPRKDFLYEYEPALEDTPVKRDYVEIELMNGDFDLLVFGSVPRQKGLIRSMCENQIFEMYHCQPVFLDPLPDGGVMKETFGLGPTFTSSPQRFSLIYLELPRCSSFIPVTDEERSSARLLAEEFIAEVELITGRKFQHE